MKRTMLFITVAGSLATGAAYAATVKDVVPEIQRLAADPVVVQAVEAQNAKGLSLEAIAAQDKLWMEAKEPTEFMTSLTTNPAASALAAAERAQPYFIEFILTDNQGANVAITAMTSDYWQGDEPKFSKAFADGKGEVYIARPQKDKSSGEVVAQVSVPVLSGGKAIGTLTVGVRQEKLP